MDEQKEPLSINNQSNMLSCPKCNFPVRSDDTKCMYCKTSLKPTGWRLYYYYFSRYFQQMLWRQRLKKRKSGRGKQKIKSAEFLKYIAFLGLGVFLTLVGGYLFIVSMLSNNFSNWIISLLFLVYGIYTLKTIFYKK